MRQGELSVLHFVLPFLLLFPCVSLARIQIADGTEDVRDLFTSAEFVFHGRVVTIEPDGKNNDDSYSGVAQLEVRRWYKGTPRQSTVRLRFAYDRHFGNGHSCIDLHRSASWLIFAKQTETGLFEFSDDCYGGLPVSSILASTSHGSGIQQMQDDLVAGLKDGDSAVRVENIKRLGGLRLPSSHDALEDIIEHGIEAESKWAIYAALRAGDLSVLPKVQGIVVNLSGYRVDPDSSIALELAHLRDPRAVPTLVAVLQSASMDFARGSAVQALQAIKDPRSVPGLANRLSDPESSIRYNALVAIGYITHEPRCTLPDDWHERDGEVDRRLASCQQWWQTQGSARKWSELKLP